MRRYETIDLSLGHAQALELRADGTVWLTGSVVAEVSREWGVWYLRQVRSLGRKYPGRYVTLRTTDDGPDAHCLRAESRARGAERGVRRHLGRLAGRT
jgi:hypothetical protein